MMCEQTGQEIDWKKCPPDILDFPDIVIDAINIFHSMGDRIYPDVGYTGKDFTNLSMLMKIHYIESHQKEYLYELLMTLDAHSIDESQRKIKAEYDKLKNKT